MLNIYITGIFFRVLEKKYTAVLGETPHEYSFQLKKMALKAHGRMISLSLALSLTS